MSGIHIMSRMGGKGTRDFNLHAAHCNPVPAQAESPARGRASGAFRNGHGICLLVCLCAWSSPGGGSLVRQSIIVWPCGCVPVRIP